MRLYLSSFRMGAGAGHLRELVGGEGRTAVIANAMDAQPHWQRQEGVDREVTALSSLGLRPEHLDLRDHFDGDGVGDRLAEYDLLWLRGGNVFVLRDALHRCGADEAIVDLIRANAVCFGGYSAGPCLLGPSIAAFGDVDDASVVAAPSGEPARDDGLRVLDWIFVPHVDSPGHPETEACGEVARRCVAEGVPVRTFRDGDVLIVDGDEEHLHR